MPVALHEIQGTGSRSPFVGRFVTTTTNVITAVLEDGLFMQAPDTEADDDPATSEAIYVAIAPVIPGMAIPGNSVVVAGIVEEADEAHPMAPTRTQIINPTVTLIANNQPRPTPAIVTAAAQSGGGPDPFERFEAMRVKFNSLSVVAPTEGFLVEPDAQGISDGVFYGVLTGTPRPFREPGIPILEPMPPGAPPEVPRFDNNPERLRVDSNALTGTPRLEVTAGATVSNLVGTFDFSEGVWTVLPEPGGSPIISGNITAAPILAASSNEFTVAAFNLERFFDTDDDPAVDETVLTASAFNGRLNKASLTIRNILRSPDILGLIEVENLTTLQTLANRVNGDAITAGQGNPGYAAWLEDGNDPGGIDVGFLVRTSRVTVVEVMQLGKTNTYVNPVSGLPETLNDRPPLLLRASVPRPGTPTPLPVTVFLNHLRSMSGIDNPSDGPRIRAKRRAQAEFLAGLVQARQITAPDENLVLIGDFNAFPFNDGYADVMGTIQGTPTPSNLVTLASADLVEPNLTNLILTLPSEQRYSFSFDGNAQALDHVLVNTTLQPRASRIVYARSNTDFPESYRSNFNRPERVSDHDVPVVYITRNRPPRDLRIQRIGPDRYQLDWTAEPGQTNRVERSSDLNGWTTAGTIIALPDGAATFTEFESGNASAIFYRIATP